MATGEDSLFGPSQPGVGFAVLESREAVPEDNGADRWETSMSA